MSEDTRMNIFNTVALGMTFFRTKEPVAQSPAQVALTAR
jgi:hypothetical protein